MTCALKESLYVTWLVQLRVVGLSEERVKNTPSVRLFNSLLFHCDEYRVYSCQQLGVIAFNNPPLIPRIVTVKNAEFYGCCSALTLPPQVKCHGSLQLARVFKIIGVENKLLPFSV